MRVMAAEKGVSVAQLVDDMARRAKLVEAVERGRKAIAEGNTVTQEDAGRRLKKRRAR
jgi:ParB-like chromosome segregation protein Spo0J